ncbi:MAG TPA: hypothetical protein VFE88_03245 [Candidatus Nanoarchaeia archaeon]|nr:hypothetical protein [Candidatus Nanoarchaeia archaeon]
MVKVAETIVKEREFSYQGAVYVKELQAYVKKWFGKNGYDLFEKGYQAKASDAGKNTTMKWEGGKKLDEYHKLVVKPIISVSNAKEAMVGGKKVVEAEIKVSLDVEVERDYEETWKGKPVKRFLRGFFDKFIATEKDSEIKRMAKREAEGFMEMVKAYFKAD